jgi:hypothetical protein
MTLHHLSAQLMEGNLHLVHAVVFVASDVVKVAA